MSDKDTNNEKECVDEERFARWFRETSMLPPSEAFSERVMREIENRPNPYAQTTQRSGPPWHQRVLAWLGDLVAVSPSRGLTAAAATFVIGFGVASLVFLNGGPASLGNSAMPAAAGQQRQLVHFKLHAPAAHQVALVGNFNHWQSRFPLHRAGNGTWVATVALPPGHYEYSFVVNSNQWVSDPTATRHCKDGFGGQDAVLTVHTGSA